MHVFQSSSFKLFCALVVPVLLADALPHPLHKRGEDKSPMLTLHGSKNGEVTGTESKTYPPVELLPIPSSGMYDVMNNWKQDGFDNEAIAVRSTDEAEWAQAVPMRSKENRLLAAGYEVKDQDEDDGKVKTWWTIEKSVYIGLES